MIACRYCGAAVRSTAQDWNDHLEVCAAYAALPKVPMQPTQLERRRGVGKPRPGYPVYKPDALARKRFDRELAKARTERLAAAKDTTLEDFGHRRYGS